jgi:hypothetical protein
MQTKVSIKASPSSSLAEVGAFINTRNACLKATERLLKRVYSQELQHVLAKFNDKHRS